MDGRQAGKEGEEEDRACGQVCGQEEEEEQCESKIGWSRIAFANTHTLSFSISISLGEQRIAHIFHSYRPSIFRSMKWLGRTNVRPALYRDGLKNGPQVARMFQAS